MLKTFQFVPKLYQRHNIRDGIVVRSQFSLKLQNASYSYMSPAARTQQAFQFHSSRFANAGNVIGKIMGFFKGKEEPAPPPQESQKTPQNPIPSKESNETQLKDFDNMNLQSIGEKVMQKMNPVDAARYEQDVKAGKFDMNTFRAQLQAATKLEGAVDAMKWVPGASKLKDMLGSTQQQIGEVQIMIKIIDVMTADEKANPDQLMQRAFQQKERIAKDSGTTLQDINRLLDYYQRVKIVTKKMNDLQKEGKSVNTVADLKKTLQESGALDKELMRNIKNLR